MDTIYSSQFEVTVRSIFKHHAFWGLLIIAIMIGSVHYARADDALPDEWRLTYSLGFDGEEDLDGLDTRYIWGRETIINKEQQFYVDPKEHGVNPFQMANGVLSITANPTDDERRPDFAGQPYTSGVLTSRTNGFSQTYGRFEVRAKLPGAAGAWPAFWLLPTFKSWPGGISVLSEIDIMEGVKDVAEGIYHVSSHSNETGALVTVTESVDTQVDLTADFHTYALEWTPVYLIYFFDGQEVFRTRTPDDMHTPRHYLLNLAVGGWAGEPDPVSYPAALEIDYVRIYQSTREQKRVIAAENKTLAQDTPITFEGLARIFNFLGEVARGEH